MSYGGAARNNGITSITGTTGGPIAADNSDNLNFTSSNGSISISGSPTLHTLNFTVAAGATGINTIDGDSGSVTGSTITITGASTGLSFSGSSTTLSLTGDLAVGHGGTGASTFTAYGVICAGTSATGAFQNVSGLGTSGYVLTSNGAGALPSWQASGGGGISTIDGNSGSVTGTTITITGSTSGLVFTGSSATLTASFSYVALPTTTSTNGQIRINNNVFMHAYGTSATYLGTAAGNFTNSSSSNVGVGGSVLSAVTSGSYNTIVGSGSGAGVTSGSNHAWFGQGAGGNLSTGGECCLIGAGAGYNYSSSESNNIVIGFNNGGVAAESGVIRIGTSSNTTCYIQGISGVTVTGSAVLCASNGQLGTISSSIRFKENIKDLGTTTLLSLRPVQFNYINKNPSDISFGLIAEEVHTIFPDLVLYHENEPYSVKYHEMPVLLLAEIQRLEKRIADLECRAA